MRHFFLSETLKTQLTLPSFLIFSACLCPFQWEFLSLFWSSVSSNVFWQTFYRTGKGKFLVEISGFGSNSVAVVKGFVGKNCTSLLPWISMIGLGLQSLKYVFSNISMVYLNILSIQIQFETKFVIILWFFRIEWGKNT